MYVRTVSLYFDVCSFYLQRLLADILLFKFSHLVIRKRVYFQLFQFRFPLKSVSVDFPTGIDVEIILPASVVNAINYLFSQAGVN